MKELRKNETNQPLLEERLCGSTEVHLFRFFLKCHAIALEIEFGYVKSHEFGANCLGNIYIERERHTHTHTLLLFKGLPLFRILVFFFLSKNVPISLCLSRDKTKEQSGKNITLTPTKKLPKKQGHYLVDFQKTLFNYKLDTQNKNYIYIYKIKTHIFFSTIQDH